METESLKPLIGFPAFLVQIFFWAITFEPATLGGHWPMKGFED